MSNRFKSPNTSKLWGERPFDTTSGPLVSPFYKDKLIGYMNGFENKLENVGYWIWSWKFRKKDYLQKLPFVRKDVKTWAKFQTWEKLADEHIRLYKNLS